MYIALSYIYLAIQVIKTLFRKHSQRILWDFLEPVKQINDLWDFWIQRYCIKKLGRRRSALFRDRCPTKKFATNTGVTLNCNKTLLTI